MKKTFALTHPKIKVPRRVESIKHEVRKYLKRERNKKLPAEADFWDFDCRFGDTQETSKVIHVSTIDACIDKAEEQERASFYLEILAKPAHRTKKPQDAENSKHAKK